MNCSVDMIRLSVKVYCIEFQDFINTYFSDSNYVNHYNKFGIADYHDNFQIKEFFDGNPFNKADCFNNFWLGYNHNTEPESKRHTLVIEYNPNKNDTSMGLLNLVLKKFFNDVDKVSFCSCDVAFDIFDAPIDNFIIDKGYKHYFCDMITDAGRTFYVGKRGSNGRIKIYDKASEQKIPDKVWTRLEVTLKFDNVFLSQVVCGSFDFDFNIPEVFYFDDFKFDDFDVKMRCYIYSLINGYVKMSDFSRKIREKIKQTLEESASIKKVGCSYKPLAYNTIISYFRNYARDFITIPDYILKKYKEEKPKEVITFGPVLKGEQLNLFNL